MVLAASEADWIQQIDDLEQAVREEGLLSEGRVQTSPRVRSRFSDEYLKRINQGGRR